MLTNAHDACLLNGLGLGDGLTKSSDMNGID